MRVERLYWVVVGIGLLLGGGAELVVGVLGVDRTVGPASVGGTDALWRGLIVTAAGGLYVHAVFADVSLVRERAVLVLAGGMLWITAGTLTVTAVLGAVPGGAEAWVAPPGAVLGALAPPYVPALLAVPFTLPAVRHLDGVSAADRLREAVAP